MKLHYYCMKSGHLIPFVKNLMMVLPIFRSNPAFDVGMPVIRATRCFIFVIPNARFHEKLRPGMGVDFLLMIRIFHQRCFAAY